MVSILERSENARIRFQTEKPLTVYYFVFVICTTTGLIEIDGLRRLKPLDNVTSWIVTKFQL